MFDNKTGDAFAVKGIDYYPRPNAGKLDENNIDFFIDDFYDVWKDDIDSLAATGANAVRLYAVDPSKSHDKFMCALRAKGMYALVDLAASCTNCAVTKDPYPACYSTTLRSRGEMIILAFAKYDNVLGVSAGNEVNHVVEGDASVNAPCQKKFVRDMRVFIAECLSIRKIPVGVVMSDRDTRNNNREVNAKYYNCRTNATDNYENVEWYGINAYQYCDGSVTDLANAFGFRQLQKDYLAYGMTVPVMLTEYGCLDQSFPKVGDYEAQRTWRQAGWLYSSNFRNVFSGAYPFTSFDTGNFGLGYFKPEDCDHDTQKCEYVPMPNYYNLSAQYKAVNITGETSLSAFKPNQTVFPDCPADFPKLSAITWASDAVESEFECPTALQSHTCEGQKSSGTWASGSGSGTYSSTTSGKSSSSGSSATTASSKSGATPQVSSAATAVSITLLSALLHMFF